MTRTMLRSVLLMTAFMASVPAALAADALPGDGKEVRLARANWDTGWFQAAIYQRAMEALGYEIDGPVTLNNGPFFQAVSQGDVDLWLNGWFPQHDDLLEQFSETAEAVGYVAKGGALQGYLIDKKTADEHGITNLSDLRRPEIASLFDIDGNGTADMVSCEPGWVCSRIIEHQLETYDLADRVTPLRATYAAAMAQALGRFRDGDPILFYTWTPNWTVGALKPGLDVIWLEVPEASLPEDQKQYEDLVEVEGVKGCSSDPCLLGWPANDLRPIANKAFLGENPAVRRLLEVASVPLEDIAAQNARMQDGEDSEKDILRHADAWIEANREVFEGWLKEARSAAGA
ncbi:glycine betaine/L-proline ABC transporter substrate-binding protein ProX [Marinimicrococcus flavescens]|uniref:Glycine betaine/L-proline ABC transporter substrate-binding protein ProX n=1 Tax=Marinimicrococcus flavescens TaxID=3031815 RepID=A0AAP4D6K9_9PROT|nr:glycine betaine/L-proline ABC transporter substrate-binding protein ProX [Marinimicrococcus flavescens]